LPWGAGEVGADGCEHAGCDSQLTPPNEVGFASHATHQYPSPPAEERSRCARDPQSGSMSPPPIVSWLSGAGAWQRARSTVARCYRESCARTPSAAISLQRNYRSLEIHFLAEGARRRLQLPRAGCRARAWPGVPGLLWGAVLSRHRNRKLAKRAVGRSRLHVVAGFALDLVTTPSAC
jgi:hypothetical protein